MPQYKYKGKNSKGKVVNGTLISNSEVECYEKVKAEGVFIYDIKETTGISRRTYKLKDMELADFSRQISTMQRSGIPVLRGIEIIRERVEKKQLIKVYDTLYQFVASGNSLSEGMVNANGSFPEIMINMYKAGEANGTLEDSAMKMATYYEGQRKINLKIKNAMAYPSILAVLTFVICIVIFTFVMPQFFDIITAAGNELNVVTAAIFGFSNFMVQKWYVCVVVLAIVVAVGYLALKAYPVQIDLLKLKIPKIQSLLIVIYTSRFARTLSSLYSSGVSMLDAVDLSSRTIGNLYLQGEFVAVSQKIRNGQSLSEAIDGTFGVDKKLISAIYVGEETGQLDSMLTSISEEYEFESNMAIERILTYVEPVMLIIMGVIIGTVVVSIFVPLMQMYSSI
ncbi:MAG: type II secretion system F family protein [Clostridia bacterium]